MPEGERENVIVEGEYMMLSCVSLLSYYSTTHLKTLLLGKIGPIFATSMRLPPTTLSIVTGIGLGSFVRVE